MQGLTKFIKLGLDGLKDNFAPLSKPYKINFAITYRCQSRCLTCNIWKTKPSNELELSEIIEFAQKNPYFKWIGLTGGEPFLRSDITEIVEAFANNSKDLYLVTIPTNSLTDKDFVLRKLENILNLGIPKVVVTLSLDGYRELHDKIRGVPGNFDKVMALAKAFAELKKKYSNFHFEFGYTISKYNLGQLEKTYQAVNNELGNVERTDFHINIGQLSDIYYNNAGEDIMPDRKALAEELSSFISKRPIKLNAMDLVEEVFQQKLIDFSLTGKSPMKSRSLDASLFLDSYGNVYPSIMWGKKLGNIRETGYDLVPIWKGKAAEEARRLISEKAEPEAWTSCEAYQSIIGNVASFGGILYYRLKISKIKQK